LFGEGALLVELGAIPTPADNARAHALAARLRADPPPGLLGLVPSYASLLVHLDPLLPGGQAIVEAALADLDAHPPPQPGRLRRVPVHYGGDDGPDLAAVAATLGLSEAEVVAAHARAGQHVYLLGFAPGLPYIGDAGAVLAPLGRRATPRERVPSGAVAIVGRQTVIYPRPTPGGWHVIGRTPLEVWDVERTPPTYFAPSDQVEFVPITPAEWPRWAGPPVDW
jgi:KipI family sensor histidine kinase inhibitor